MNPSTTPDAVASHVVLTCQGCRYAFEPAGSDWTPEYLRALANGCPECGDWLYLGELANPTPRKAQP